MSEANATLASFDDARHRSVPDGGQVRCGTRRSARQHATDRKKAIFLFSRKAKRRRHHRARRRKARPTAAARLAKGPKTSVVRNGSRLNEILIVRLDPGEMDEADPLPLCRGHRRLFGHLYARRMFCHRLAEVRDGRQRRSQMFLSQLRIQSAGRRASRVRARAPASAGTAAGNSRRLAHHSCNIRWKGRCSTTRVMGRGRIGFPCPRRSHHRGWAKRKS